jgi:hypothetical protein
MIEISLDASVGGAYMAAVLVSVTVPLTRGVLMSGPGGSAHASAGSKLAS